MPAKPAIRRQSVKICQRFAALAVTPGGWMVQKARIPEVNIVAHHQGATPLSPFTMRMPSASKASVLVTTCKTILQRASPRFKREPRANGIDMPTRNRNAGKTKSTNVIPLPVWWRSLKCAIQSGTIFSGAPARSFTKIIMNITKPRKASMEVIRETCGVAKP